MADLNLVQTFHREFSGSYRAENLILYDQNWGWTKGNRKQPKGFRAQAKNVTEKY